MDRRRAIRRTYDRIADRFARTREYPWPEFDEFVADAPDGELGLDVGCANGRHFRGLARRTDRVVGVDVSRELLSVALERLPVDDPDSDSTTPVAPVALLQGDATNLPIATGRVDLAAYVATIHHLPDRAERIRTLDELARVLAPDGRALVSAWSTTHDRFDRESGFDTVVDWTLPDGESVPRFYHIYDFEEFRADLADSDLVVVDAYLSSGNCYGEVIGPDRE